MKIRVICVIPGPETCPVLSRGKPFGDGGCGLKKAGQHSHD